MNVFKVSIKDVLETNGLDKEKVKLTFLINGTNFTLNKTIFMPYLINSISNLSIQFHINYKNILVLKYSEKTENWLDNIITIDNTFKEDSLNGTSKTLSKGDFSITFLNRVVSSEPIYNLYIPEKAINVTFTA